MTSYTHYIPAFTRQNGRTQQAACLLYIRPSEHSNEPTCPECAAWLAADVADPRTGEDVFGTAEECRTAHLRRSS